jgi:hypothetical protein
VPTVGIFFAAFALSVVTAGELRADVVLASEAWSISIQPSSLHLSVKPTNGRETVVSAPLPDLGPARR